MSLLTDIIELDAELSESDPNRPITVDEARELLRISLRLARWNQSQGAAICDLEEWTDAPQP